MDKQRFARMIDVARSFDETVTLVTDLLAEQSFGVLSTIDVAATLHKKLGVEGPRYVILGACSPAFAHRALQAVESIGVLLPCNVVVKELDGATSRVFLTDVEAVFTLVDADGMADIATEVSARMDAVAAGLQAASGA